jgi:hypothetical protein
MLLEWVRTGLDDLAFKVDDTLTQIFQGQIWFLSIVQSQYPFFMLWVRNAGNKFSTSRWSTVPTACTVNETQSTIMLDVPLGTKLLAHAVSLLTASVTLA